MILFFDTETTGLPRNWKAPIQELDNWPRLVQIAWILFDDVGKKLYSKEYIIKPDHFVIPIEASKVHKITTELALLKGQKLLEILIEFNLDIDKADILVAHNINFDLKIIGAEMLRAELETKLFSKRKICTMESSTNYCKIPGPYGFKWPRLDELYFKLFGGSFQEAHNASIDINATAKCYWRLKELGLIQLSCPEIGLQ